MTETRPPFGSFPDGLNASLSHPSGEAVLRRLNAKRLLRLAADEFIASQRTAHVRILTDSRLVGAAWVPPLPAVSAVQYSTFVLTGQGAQTSEVLQRRTAEVSGVR